MTTFADFGLAPELVGALDRHGITTPFGIQSATLPDSLAGRDILGRGPTGSGKTVAFALPLVTRIAASGAARRKGRPSGLVLVPTRELAVQVERTVSFLAKAAGLRTMTVYGGVGYTGQLKRLGAGVDVVIATPGRLEDLVAQGACRLSEVQVTVLDEADLMADMGFLPPVRRLLDLTPPGQRMLFSATLDGDVDRLVADYLVTPVAHAVGADAGDPAEHLVFLVTRENKVAVLADLASGAGRTLVFARTKHGAARFAAQLSDAGVPARELHGNLGQGMRQRNLADFSEGRVRVLVATDVAARGIHVDDVALVVHADPPAEAKSFLHRSGRTARAGATGTVVTLCQRDQNRKVKALLTAAGITNPRREVVEPGSPVIAEVRGPAAPPPAPEPERHFEPKRRTARAAGDRRAAPKERDRQPAPPRKRGKTPPGTKVERTKGRRKDQPAPRSTGSRRGAPRTGR
jgi:superfamily II DNA/RNA helicase